MKHIEYLKCIPDLNVEIDFGVNGAIVTSVTKWELMLFRKWIIFIANIITFKYE